MREEPLISIVVPIYNVEKYLRQCLDSIINQTYKNIEIILVEDYSQDSSLEIAKEYEEKDSRIILLENNENKGVSYSRNKGIEKAKGDYIIFIDSDDWINSIFIEELYRSFNKEDIVFSMPYMLLFNINDNIFYKDNYHSNIEFLKNERNKKVLKESIFNNLTSFNISSIKLWDLKFIKENNIKFPEGLYFEDNVFTYEYLLKSDKKCIAFNHKAVLFYRTKIGSSITNSDKKIKDIIKVNKKVKDLFIKHNLFKKYYNSINEYLYNNIIAWGFAGRNNKIVKDIIFFKEAKNFINNELDTSYLENEYKKVSKSFCKKIYLIKNNHYILTYLLLHFKSSLKNIVKIFRILFILIFHIPKQIIRYYR